MMQLGWKFVKADYTSFASYMGEEVYWNTDKTNIWSYMPYVRLCRFGFHASFTLNHAVKAVSRSAWNGTPRLLRVAAIRKHYNITRDPTAWNNRLFDYDDYKFCSHRMRTLVEIDYSSALRSTLMLFGWQWSDRQEVLYDELREEDFKDNFIQNLIETYRTQYPDLYNLELRHRTFSI